MNIVSIRDRLMDWMKLIALIGAACAYFVLLILCVMEVRPPTDNECEDMMYEEGTRCVRSYISATRCIMNGIIKDSSNTYACAAWCANLAVLCPKANDGGCFAAAAVFQSCLGDNRSHTIFSECGGSWIPPSKHLDITFP